MSYIEDIIELAQQEEAQSRYKRPEIPSHYNSPVYKNEPPRPAPPAAGAANKPLPKYGADMKIHQKDESYAGEEQRGVEYTKLSERVTRYKVGISGQMTRGAAGEILDTPALKLKAIQEFGSNIGAANIVPDSGSSPALDAMVKEWSEKSLIWVCIPIDLKDARQSVFYSNVCRPGAFHHSSLGAGREVLGAGEWIVESGKLKKISANSGHYQPSLTSLHQSVLVLTSALQPDTTVLLWNKKSDQWEDVPVNNFIKDPGGAGKYKSHWRAPD